MTHTQVHGFERKTDVVRLSFNNNASQWIDTSAARSCYCASSSSIPCDWVIEARLPDGGLVQVGNYPATQIPINNGEDYDLESTLFDPAKPRYATVNAVAGLPIRFVSSVVQPPNYSHWIILKS